MPFDPTSIPAVAWFVHNILVAWHAVLNRAGEMIAPTFLAFMLGILALERLFPARPRQKVVSASLAQDAVWFLIQSAGEATVLAAYAVFLAGIYERHLDFLTIQPMTALPAWLSLVSGIVFMDFLRWLQHVVQHKVPWFWHFHVVHHSQRNLNLFTDFRYHVVEYLVRQTVYFIPLMMFGVELPEMILFSLFLIWHARLYHGNIKSDFGLLRYVVVTPQSHRVHHSIESRHRDKNYGAFLSIWDRIFGTQYRGHLEYPETGISEASFPEDGSIAGFKLILKPIEQMIYPFQAIGKSLCGKLRRG